MLEKVKSGIENKPLFMILFGVAGCGKSTFASRFPKPLFADIEKGTGKLNVARLSDFPSLEDFNTTLDDLLKGGHGYETFVVDTLDALERLVWRDVCEETNKKSIEEIPYGKGYLLALKQWEVILTKLKELREKMNVVLIAHSQIRKINDPMQLVSYDQFAIKLHHSAAALFKESVDAMLFCTYEIFVQSNEGQTKGKALGDGNRVMYTSSMPGHDGKNRFGLPYMLALDFDKFMGEVRKDEGEKKIVLYKKLKDQIPLISDEKTRSKASKHLETHKDDLGELMKTDKRVQEYLSTGTGA